MMGGRTFDCLEAVINRYRTEQIVEGHTLGHPVKRVRRRSITVSHSLLSWLYNDAMMWSFVFDSISVRVVDASIVNSFRSDKGECLIFIDEILYDASIGNVAEVPL